MIYENLVDTVSTSFLGLGMMRYNSIEDMQYNIDMAMSYGVTYYEACYFYNNYRCENMLSSCLSKYDRFSYQLADKLPTNLIRGPDHLKDLFKQQLINCNTHYFDFYLLQALDRYLYDNVINYHMIDILDNYKKLGKIEYLGFSFHDTPEILDKYLDLYDWDFVQLQLNYYDWFLSQGKDLYDVAVKHNINIIVMGPAKGGLLVDNLPVEAKRYLSSIGNDSLYNYAIRFLSLLPNVKVILSGATDREQLCNNLELFSDNSKMDLTNYEIVALQKVVKIYAEYNSIQCTGCNYCKCSQGVSISEIFKLYNKLIINYDKNTMNEYIQLFKSSKGIYSCIECNQCVSKCPQHLNIPKLLHNQIFAFRA